MKIFTHRGKPTPVLLILGITLWTGALHAEDLFRDYHTETAPPYIATPDGFKGSKNLRWVYNEDGQIPDDAIFASDSFMPNDLGWYHIRYYVIRGFIERKPCFGFAPYQAIDSRGAYGTDENNPGTPANFAGKISKGYLFLRETVNNKSQIRIVPVEKFAYLTGKTDAGKTAAVWKNVVEADRDFPGSAVDNHPLGGGGEGTFVKRYKSNSSTSPGVYLGLTYDNNQNGFERKTYFVEAFQFVNRTSTEPVIITDPEIGKAKKGPDKMDLPPPRQYEIPKGEPTWPFEKLLIAPDDIVE